MLHALAFPGAPTLHAAPGLSRGEGPAILANGVPLGCDPPSFLGLTGLLSHSGAGFWSDSTPG